MISVSLQNDQLYSVAERDVQQGAERVSKLTGHAFGGITEESGKGNDGEGIHGKDEAGRGSRNLADGDADGDKDQHQVHELVVTQDLLEDLCKSNCDVGLLLLLLL